MTQYQRSQFFRRLILDQAIATVSYTAAEREQLRYQLQGGNYQTWLKQQGVTNRQFENWLDREIAIRKFQQQQWGRKLNSYFLQRKHQLDQVICSLIYLRDRGIAQELYFRIAEGEELFADIARSYSFSPEAKVGGRMGPVQLGDLHPHLARMFYGGYPGQLWEPTVIDEWIVIARLEQSLPVQLDESMQQFLLNELLENWLQEQLQQRFPSR